MLSEIQPFFLNKCFLHCFKPLVNFQSPEKVAFDNFFSVLLFFLWRNGFLEVLILSFQKCFLQKNFKYNIHKEKGPNHKYSGSEFLLFFLIFIFGYVGSLLLCVGFL